METALVKKPYQKQNYTNEQITEFMLCADPVTGPHYFLSNFFYVQHPMKGKIKYAPFEYQDRLIDVYHTSKRSISLLPRQCGKCLCSNTNITIRNKEGIVYSIPIGVFHEYQAARKQGTELPDISKYQI